MNKTIRYLIAILMIAISAYIATATWTVSSSPTTAHLNEVKAQNGYAIASTAPSGGQLFYYNRTNWRELSIPSGVPLISGNPYIYIDKATDGKFYVYFQNISHYQLWQLEPSNASMTIIENTTFPTGYSGAFFETPFNSITISVGIEPPETFQHIEALV